MGITPIERLKAWFIGLFVETKCNWCKSDGDTYRSAGGYRYCNEQCETADAEDQAYTT